MVSNPITNKDRFINSSSACPICHGWDREERGIGKRCTGYRSSDGEYVFCTRDQYAGELEPHGNTSPPAYMHKMHGTCKCGVTHGAALTVVRPSEKDARMRHIKEYTYQDKTGRIAYQALRYEPKRFNQRRPDGKGGWAYNMQGVTYVPYHLPELIKAKPETPVYIVEGEKDVDNLAHIGLVATCNIQGAGKWREEYNQYLKGRHVVLIPDNDKAGWDHVEKVKQSLTGVAASIKVVELPGLPEKGDVSDWLEKGGTRAKLEEMSKPPKRKFTYASEVEEEPISWIWENRIAKGNFTLVVGDAGVGKGLTISAIIERVTRGAWGSPGGVILMSPEDSASQTLVPRLKAAGADTSKVLLLNKVDEIDSTTGEVYQRPVSFPEDAHILREAIEDAGAVLVIIDPVLQMLGDRVDAYKNHVVRRAVAQVMLTAEKHNCAVLGVMHTTKSQHPNVLFRSSSSSAFIEIARTALFFVPDPDGEPGQSGVIVNYKNNLAKHADSVRYAIHGNEKHIGFISWEGVSDYTREELLNQSASTSDNKKSEGETDIINILKWNGEAMSVEEIMPHTKQKFDALRKMLQRKVEEGTVWRTARGKFTFAGNSLYKNDVPNVPNVTSVPNVPNVPKGKTPESLGHFGTMSQTKNGNEAAPVAGSHHLGHLGHEQTGEMSQTMSQTSNNGHEAAYSATEEDDMHCKVCNAEVEHYTEDGTPYCSEHYSKV